MVKFVLMLTVRNGNVLYLVTFVNFEVTNAFGTKYDENFLGNAVQGLALDLL